MLNTYNLTMLTDFYEITMANGYFNSDIKDAEACFDVFFRRVPDGGGFAIMAGLEQIIAYMKRLSFTEEDTEYLRSKNCFSEEFLDFLRDFKFSCDVWAVPEGYPIFPHEPVMIVKGPLIQAQFVETFILMQFNHQSLVATKSNRIARTEQMLQSMEPEHHILQDASAQHALSLTETTTFRLSAQWRTAGCRASTQNMKRSTSTPSCIRRTRLS